MNEPEESRGIRYQRNTIIMIDTADMTRLREVDEYAKQRGIGRGEAIIQLVNARLSDGPNPWHASIRACAETNDISEDEAYALIWGDDEPSESEIAERSWQRYLASTRADDNS